MYDSPDLLFPAPAAPSSFSAEDRARFAELKERLRQRLGPRPDSRAVYEAAQIMAEIDRDRLYGIDDHVELSYWCHKIYQLSQRQVEKYLRVARVLTEKDIRNAHMGIEALDQLALTPSELRHVVRRWADDVSAGALAAGRLAGVEALKRGSLARAEGAFERAMHTRTLQETARSKVRRERKRLPPPQRLVGTLQRCVADLERVMTNNPSPAELALVREQLHRLVNLDPHFALRFAKSPPAEMIAEAPRAQATLPRASKATLQEAPLPARTLEPGEPQEPVVVRAPEVVKKSKTRKASRQR